MKLNHLFSLSLSLTFVACQVSAPLVQSPIDPSIATVSQTSVHHVQMPEEQIRVTLGSHSGFTTQEAQIDQLAFVQIMVTGDGISTPITSSDGLVPVTNGNVNTVVSGIPQNDGKIRFVEMQGYDANRQPLVGLKAKAWYRSQTNVNTLNITVSRAQILLVNVLKSLLVTRPNVLASLDIAALQTVLLEALDYDADTQTFAQQPETLSGVAIAALLTTPQTLLDASTVRAQEATSRTVSLTVTTQNAAPLPEAVRFVLNDTVSLPQVLKTGTPSGASLSFANVPEGTYTLEAIDSNDAVIASTAVNVGATVTVTKNPLVLPFNAVIPVDIQVNTYTSGGQQNASIASDANGNFVVTWQSDGQDGSYGGIYAQRYTATGAVQGSEFRVNTYTTNNQNNPAVAMDADGDFVVTWTSANQEGEYGEDIYAQRYTASGAPDGSEFRINTYTTGSQTNASVAMAADGDFVVTWESSAKFAGKNGIYAQRYAASGALQDSEFKVNTYTSSSQRDPAVAMAADGDFVVAWQTLGQDGSGDGIYAQRYDMTGASEGSEFRVNTYTSSDQSSPAVAMDADGDFVVTWQSYYQDESLYSVYAQRYAASGGALGSEFKVNTYTTSSQRYSAVAMDADGDFVVTWQSRGQDGNATSVYAQRYDMTGVAQGSEFRVNAQTFDDQSSPAVAIDADGDFVVAWQSYYQDGDDDGIYLARYSPLGVRK
jgi:hypothetical protein